MSDKQKPIDYDQLYPGRFMKAGELLGRKITVTITDADVEMLEGEDGPKVKAILSFAETNGKQHVMCKTNGLCIKAMFGSKLADWKGKRVTLFPTVWNGKPCIRVHGSPDIDRDVDVEVKLPKRRPFKMTMHKVEARPRGQGGEASGGATSAAP